MTEDSRDWRRLAELLVARRTALGYGAKKREAFAREKGFRNSRVISDLEKARRASYDDGTFAQVEQAYRWETGSVRAVLEGGDPVELPQLDLVWPAEPEIEVPADVHHLHVPPVRERNPVLAAIEADPYLSPEAKAHFLNQYELLLRVLPREDTRLQYVAHGKRTTPIDEAEEARIEAEARAAREANPDAPGWHE